MKLQIFAEYFVCFLQNFCNSDIAEKRYAMESSVQELAFDE